MMRRASACLGLLLVCTVGMAIAFRSARGPGQPDAIYVENTVLLVDDLPVWQARDLEVRVRNEGPEALKIVGLTGY